MHVQLVCISCISVLLGLLLPARGFVIFPLNVMRTTTTWRARSSVAALHMCEPASDRAARRAARAAKLAAAEVVETPKWTVGADLPPEIAQMTDCIYDMVLVERINAPKATASGIVLPPGKDGQDLRQMGRVLGIPKPGHGLESEQGRIQPLSELLPDVRVGDIVFLQDVWGIGPKLLEVGERKFSFHKAEKVIGLMRDRN